MRDGWSPISDLIADTSNWVSADPVLMQVNDKNTEVLKDGTFEKLSWELVIVGDILKVNNDEEFPADMVFLCSSDSQGVFSVGMYASLILFSVI